MNKLDELLEGATAEVIAGLKTHYPDILEWAVGETEDRCNSVAAILYREVAVDFEGLDTFLPLMSRGQRAYAFCMLFVSNRMATKLGVEDLAQASTLHKVLVAAREAEPGPGIGMGEPINVTLDPQAVALAAELPAEHRRKLVAWMAKISLDPKRNAIFDRWTDTAPERDAAYVFLLLSVTGQLEEARVNGNQLAPMSLRIVEAQIQEFQRLAWENTLKGMANGKPGGFRV